jgi:phage antirepressor YoqD-like protein
MLQTTNNNQDQITSLELVKQINLFRDKEGNRSELRHNDLLKIIRDEFEDEINEGKISHVTYKDKKGELRPMFELTISQAKQVLLRESKFVRKAVVHYLEELEEKVKKPQFIDFSSPEVVIQLAKNWKDEKEKRELAEKQLIKQSAKIEFIDRVLDTEEKLDIGQCAKILELPFGRNILYRELRERGIFFKNKNEPKQFYMERQYFQLRETVIPGKDNQPIIKLKVLVTQRGLGFLSTLFKAEPKSKINAQLN